MRALVVMTLLASLTTRSWSREFSDIYDGCGDTKSCWGRYEEESRDCDWTAEECDILVSWIDNGDDTMTFEVQSKSKSSTEDIDFSDHYISVSFSRDTFYADDTTIGCSHGFEDSEPTTRLFQKLINGFPVYIEEDVGLETVEIEGNTGFAYASFIRPVSIAYEAPTGPISSADEVNDLSAEPFYIMVALGFINQRGGIGEYEMEATSDEPYLFVESGESPTTTTLSPTEIQSTEDTTTSNSPMSSSVSAFNIVSGVIVSHYAMLH